MPHDQNNLTPLPNQLPLESHLDVQDQLLYQVVGLHDELYLEYAKYKKEVDFALEQSGLKQAGYGRILDAGCGTGFHAMLLHKQGYDVVGLDLSYAMLRRAKSRCPTLPLMQADLRTFSIQTSFDLVLCLYGAINYLETAEQVKTTLKNFLHHLKPGGAVVIDTRWSERLPQEHWLEMNEHMIILKRWGRQQGANGSDLYAVSLFDPKNSRHLLEIHNLYNQDPFALRKLMEKVGFDAVRVCTYTASEQSFLSATDEHNAVIIGYK